MSNSAPTPRTISYNQTLAESIASQQHQHNTVVRSAEPRLDAHLAVGGGLGPHMWAQQHDHTVRPSPAGTTVSGCSVQKLYVRPRPSSGDRQAALTMKRISTLQNGTPTCQS